MSDKITLQSVSSIDNSLINAINNNNATIIAAFDNTLSRDGTSPNQMTNTLDMNSKQIINIPFATASTQPVALGQIANKTSLIPALTGDVTGSFDGNSIPTTITTVNSNIGTFQGITVNGKGQVTAASNQNYITGNQTITLSGDVSGSGTTAITTTLGAGKVGISNINSSAVATTAQYLNNTSSLLLETDKVWGAAAWVTITFASTTTLDFSTFINCKETLTGNVTFAAPSNLKDGQAGVIKLIQDGTGSRTATWNAVFKWTGGGTAPTLQTAANSTDFVYYVIDGSNVISTYVKGF